MTVYASILSPGKTVKQKLDSKAQRGYVHLATSAFRAPDEAPSDDLGRLFVTVGDVFKTLKEGDGLYIHLAESGAEISFNNEGAKDAEFVLFEMYA